MVTRALAERISDIARTLERDEDSDTALRRLTDLGVDLVPGATAAAVTIATDGHALTFAASDPRVRRTAPTAARRRRGASRGNLAA